MCNLFFILIIYAYLVFANDGQLVFQLFSGVHEYLLNVIVTGFFDIMAHFNNEFKMPSTVFKVIGVVASCLLQYFYFFLNVHQIFINSINFFIPFKRVNLSFNYGVFFRLIHLIETYLFWIKEIHLRLFRFAYQSWFLFPILCRAVICKSSRRHHWVLLNFNSINDLILASKLLIFFIISLFFFALFISFIIWYLWHTKFKFTPI